MLSSQHVLVEKRQVNDVGSKDHMLILRNKVQQTQPRLVNRRSSHLFTETLEHANAQSTAE